MSLSKFKITAAPLPVNFRGTPQEFIDALLERLEISSDASPFTSGATAPAGNEGPWFKNGTDLYVWDETTSTYIPLDLSASILPQILASEVAPDPDEHPLWYKLSGTTVVGLFYFDTGTQAWVTEPTDIADGSIGTTELGIGAVVSQKIKNLAVTVAKLAGGLTFNKSELGLARDFGRMNAAGDALEWQTVFFETEEASFTAAGGFITYAHGLAAKPFQVQLSAIWKGPGAHASGVAEGEEIVLGDTYSGSSTGNSLQITDDEIIFHSGPGAALGPDGSVITLAAASGWALKAQYVAA